MLKELFRSLNDVKNALNSQTIKGASFSEKAIIAACSLERFIYVCNDFVSANKVKKQFESLNLKTAIIVNGYEPNVENGENLFPLINNLGAFLNGTLDALLVLPNVLLTKIPADIFKGQLTINRKTSLSINEIELKLEKLGYIRQNIVSSAAEFAIRGDIVDIFPVGQDVPIRIDLFGDEIEKLKTFNPITMDKINDIDEVNILPAGFSYDFNGVSILDFCQKIFIDEPKKVFDELQILTDSYKAEKNINDDFLIDIASLINRNYIAFNSFSENGYDIRILGAKNYVYDFKSLSNDLINLSRNGMRIILSAGDKEAKTRLERFLQENHISFYEYKDNLKQGVAVIEEYLPFTASFLNDDFLIVGSDSLIKRNSLTSIKNKRKVFYLPKIGDYVVHAIHGIGKCIKIERLKISDYEKDYFIIEYKNGGILYLPSEQASMLSAYLGAESSPKLNVLGGKEFEKIKARVKAGLKDMALELAKLYKERGSVKGYKYSKDGYLENEFDNAFPYEETDDQITAINEIKQDMENGKVMDRLVCGDVGYGKTEVALRAAFKAICNKKQVALLCPTTILSQQHYKTAVERMKDFFVKVEVLNRFKSLNQVKDILNRLSKGEIDLIIGTHRLLNEDVKFNDLGLLILDEEQRFGVAHKEKIKKLKGNIDVLALSATPIPRTLHMSLSGIRDISVIETPPKLRLPIQTYVTDYSDDLLSDVSRRELSRGGQVLIIFNRVEFIYEFANRVKELLPEARVGIAHGQMPERELEKVIEKLYEGDYDILISTTLIENGIDLPLANTLFVVNSDRLGLSALYQLRGRIGRSDRLAYCYLTYERNKVLTEEAYKRLEAIEEFRELGSGFKVAMRDLEIRGAGNVLGKEQHGHMEKVGYDMYIKLLDETLKELEGKNKEILHDVKLEIAMNAFISEDYILDEAERIKVYTNISEIRSAEEMNEIIITLTDSFGELPNPVLNLIKIAFLKNLASHFNIKKIIINSRESGIYLEKSEEFIDESLNTAINKFGASLKFKDLPIIKFEDSKLSVNEKLAQILSFLQFASLVNDKNA